MSTPAKTPQSAAAKRVAAYRKRMRQSGYVPRTVWVRDINDPALAAKINREIESIAAGDPAGDAALEWIEKIYEWPAYEETGQPDPERK